MPDAFHVTFEKNVPGIRRNGLQVGKPRNWKNNLGADLGDKRSVYFIATLDAAIVWGTHMEWQFRETGDRIVIIRFAAPETSEPDGPHLHTGSDQWRKSRTAIPAASILEIIPLTAEMKKDYVSRQRPSSAAS